MATCAAQYVDNNTKTETEKQDVEFPRKRELWNMGAVTWWLYHLHMCSLYRINRKQIDRVKPLMRDTAAGLYITRGARAGYILFVRSGI